MADFLEDAAAEEDKRVDGLQVEPEASGSSSSDEEEVRH
jgi:hypothetical protein